MIKNHVRFCWLLLLTPFLFHGKAVGQSLSKAGEQILRSARSRYYNLAGRGFQSATCSIKFDFSTVPAVGSDEGRKIVEATRFTLHYSGEGTTVEHKFSNSNTSAAQREGAPLTDLLATIVTGVFQTWPTKGLQGPIPPFDSEIDAVSAKPDGYELVLRVPGGPAKVELDQQFVAREILSGNGNIDERPVYKSTPDGLVYIGNTAHILSENGAKTEISYELEPAEVDHLILPVSVRVRVNANVDLKFALTDCRVEKGTVVNVGPQP